MSFILGLLSLGLSTQVFAGPQLTVKCDVEEVGERTDSVSHPQVSFDAAARYPSLNLEFYDMKVSVGVTFTMDTRTQMCSHSVDQICLDTEKGSFCTSGPQAVLYPSEANGGQVGARTSLSCSLVGDVPKPCN